MKKQLIRAYKIGYFKLRKFQLYTFLFREEPKMTLGKQMTSEGTFGLHSQEVPRKKRSTEERSCIRSRKSASLNTQSRSTGTPTPSTEREWLRGTATPAGRLLAGRETERSHGRGGGTPGTGTEGGFSRSPENRMQTSLRIEAKTGRRTETARRARSSPGPRAHTATCWAGRGRSRSAAGAQVRVPAGSVPPSPRGSRCRRVCGARAPLCVLSCFPCRFSSAFSYTPLSPFDIFKTHFSGWKE